MQPVARRCRAAARKFRAAARRSTAEPEASVQRVALGRGTPFPRRRTQQVLTRQEPKRPSRRPALSMISARHLSGFMYLTVTARVKHRRPCEECWVAGSGWSPRGGACLPSRAFLTSRSAWRTEVLGRHGESLGRSASGPTARAFRTIRSSPAWRPWPRWSNAIPPSSPPRARPSVCELRSRTSVTSQCRPKHSCRCPRVSTGAFHSSGRSARPGPSIGAGHTH